MALVPFCQRLAFPFPSVNQDEMMPPLLRQAFRSTLNPNNLAGQLKEDSPA
jgi:hypothetical protein